MDTQNGKLKEGWIAIWRCLFKSEIWEQEPWRLKAWLYMIGQANHSDKTEFGRNLKRGQLLVNRIKDLNRAIRWRRGSVWKTPTVEATKTLWWWLRQKGMITTKRTTRGTIITILNYPKYQDIKKLPQQPPQQPPKQPLQQPASNRQPPTIDNNVKQLKQLNNTHIKLCEELSLNKEVISSLISQYKEKQVESALKIYRDNKDRQEIRNPIGYLTYLCGIGVKWEEGEDEKWLKWYGEKTKKLLKDFPR